MMKWIVCGLAMLFAGCGGSTDPLPILSDKFFAIQKQTLSQTCASGSCHGDGTKGPFLWLTPDSAYNQLLFSHPIENDEGAKKYKALVVPFKPDSSFLVVKITNPTPLEGALMPNNNTGRLPQNQIDAIISWIKRGAPND